MSTDGKWKDALLKSGLPLEYEVKTFLEEQKKCLIKWEQSYLKSDENGLAKEFSYDLNASYIKMPYDVEFMVECKFRSEDAKWFFLPEQYGGMDEIYQNSFMHAIDYFHKWTWAWNQYMPYCESLAPLCSKGIEIYGNGNKNNKSIPQAISQLSYGLAKQITGTISDHIDEEHGIHFREIFVPVVVTTAELFRFREDLGIEELKKASDPDTVATTHDILVVKRDADLSLYNHNMSMFAGFIAGHEDLLTQKVKSFTCDIQHLFHVISQHYCPQALVIIHHSKANAAFERLFEMVDKFIFPSDELLKKRVAYHKSIEAKFGSLEKLKDRVKESNKGESLPQT